MAEQDVLGLRTVQGCQRQILRNAPIKMRTRKRRGSFGAAEEQLSPNSKRRFEMGAKESSTDETEKGTGEETYSHITVDPVVAPQEDTEPQSISQVMKTLDAARGRRDDAQTSSTPSEVNKGFMYPSIYGPALAQSDQDWVPPGYPVSARPARVEQTLHIVGEGAPGMTGYTATSIYETVQSEIRNNKDEEGFQKVTYRRSRTKSDSLESSANETPLDRLRRNTRKLVGSSPSSSSSNRYSLLAEQDLEPEMGLRAEETTLQRAKEANDNALAMVQSISNMVTHQCGTPKEKVLTWRESVRKAGKEEGWDNSPIIPVSVAGIFTSTQSTDLKVREARRQKRTDPEEYGNTGIAFQSVEQIDTQIAYLQKVRKDRILKEGQDKLQAKRIAAISRSGPGPSGTQNPQGGNEPRSERGNSTKGSESPPGDSEDSKGSDNEDDLPPQGPPQPSGPSSSDESDDEKKRDIDSHDSSSEDKKRRKNKDKGKKRKIKQESDSSDYGFKPSKFKNKDAPGFMRERKEKTYPTVRFPSLKPAENLNAGSFLMKAIDRSQLRGYGRMGSLGPVKGPNGGPGDPGDSDDDPLIEPESINSSDLEETKKTKKRHKKAWKQAMFRMKIRSMGAKAIAPTPYDGEASMSKISKFVAEINLYMRQTGLEMIPEEQVGILPSFLKGKAMDFYRQKVGVDDQQWTLPEFFEELINYCFPATYVEDLRKQFHTSKQGRRNMHKYLHDMQELANSIGDVSDRELIHRIWDGTHSEYQRQLRLDCLSPETVSLEDLRNRLESIERANEAVGIKWHEWYPDKEWSPRQKQRPRRYEKHQDPPKPRDATRTNGKW